MKRTKTYLVRGKYAIRIVVTGKCLTPSCDRRAIFFCERCYEAIAAFKKIETAGLETAGKK